MNWENMCQPKENGGLGLKRLQESNFSFIAKLCWRFLKHPDELWVRVLKGKYHFNLLNPDRSSYSSTASSTWQKIMSLWPFIFQKIRWSLGCGDVIAFWNDIWFDEEPLITRSLCDIPDDIKSWRVKDAMGSDGNWQIETLSNLLPNSVLEDLPNYCRPCTDLGNDSRYWRHAPDGNFSVASAYRLLIGNSLNPENPIWKLVWSWAGPQRISSFLWLAYKNRLLTNVERQRRHLSPSAVCSICNSVSESTLHVLRDCDRAKALWLKFLPEAEVQNFFNCPSGEWFLQNLLGSFSASNGISWTTLFGFTSWYLWKWRNESIFTQAESSIQAKFNQILTAVQSAIAAQRTLTMSRIQESHKVETLVGWKAPAPGCIALNTDGACRQSVNMSSAGGVFRDHNGIWLGVFLPNSTFAAHIVRNFGVFYMVYSRHGTTGGDAWRFKWITGVCFLFFPKDLIQSLCTRMSSTASKLF